MWVFYKTAYLVMMGAALLKVGFLLFTTLPIVVLLQEVVAPELEDGLLLVRLPILFYLRIILFLPVLLIFLLVFLVITLDIT